MKRAYQTSERGHGRRPAGRRAAREDVDRAGGGGVVDGGAALRLAGEVRVEGRAPSRRARRDLDRAGRIVAPAVAREVDPRPGGTGTARGWIPDRRGHPRMNR